MSRVAVVTGGASGIGAAVARRLADDGIQVLIVDLDPAGAEVATGIGGSFVEADLADPDAAERVIEHVQQRHRGLDLLVNNAGFQHVAPIAEFDPAVWHRMLAVMLTSPFLLMRSGWALLERSGSGRVVNIASIHALVASPFKAGYVAAKHGLAGLTKVAALEGAEHGITVNAVCPAYVRTPLVEAQIRAQAAEHGIEPQEVIERVMLEPAAVKRLIEPEEVAGLVGYLCSEAASAITGALWEMDLGWTAR